MRRVVKAILVAVGMLASAPVFAADLPTKKEPTSPIPEPVLPSTWIFDFTVYGWALNMTGNSGIA